MTESYDPETGHYETEAGLCALCGETAIKPYLCGVCADALAAEDAEAAWWDALEPPLAVYHAEMAQWFEELHPQQEETAA